MEKQMPQKNQQRTKQNNSANTLRIIGGEWRSRKLTFVDATGLRPTPDRVRETLFNWLQGHVHGSSCLDLFAGSGALGIEALSRGAKKLIFVETNQPVARQLENNLSVLNADANVIQDDALSYLLKCNAQFDLIFLDPPYRKNLLAPALRTILEKKLLTENGLIYVEHESEELYNWDEYQLEKLKETTAGQVNCCLLRH